MFDLHGQVPIAQVPGELEEVIGALGTDLGKRFGRADHLDEAAVLQLDGIARTQRDRLRQIKQERKTADTFQRDPPAVTIVEFQHDAVGCITRPVASRDNFVGPDHPDFLNSFVKRGDHLRFGSRRRKRGRELAGSS